MTGLSEPLADGRAPLQRGRGVADAVALLAAWLGPILATVVATPYVLDRIGPAEYGLLTIVLGIVVSMAAVGMSRPLAISTAADGAADVRRAAVWGVALGVAGAVAVAVLAASIPLTWLVGDDVESGQARLAVLAGAFAVLGTALMTTASGRVIGMSRFVAVGSITAMVGAATSVGYVVVSSLGGLAVALVLWNGAVTTCGALFLLVAGRRRATTPVARSERTDSAVPSVWPFIVVQLLGNFAIVVERIGLAASTDLETVTTFVVPHMMVLTLHGGLVWLTAPLLTRAVHLHRAGDFDGLTATYQTVSRFAMAVATFVGVSLAINGHTLLDRWLGGDSVLGRIPFMVLTAYAVGLSVSVVAWNIADATGHAVENARVGIVWFVFVVAGAVASQRFGVDATVAARGALVLTLPAYIIRVERCSLRGARAWSRSWIAHLAMSAVVVAVVEWGLWAVLGRGLTAVAISVIVGGLVFVALAPQDLRNAHRWRTGAA